MRVMLLSRITRYAACAVIVTPLLGLAACGNLEDHAKYLTPHDQFGRKLPKRKINLNPPSRVGRAFIPESEIEDIAHQGAAEDIFDLVFHPNGESVLFSYCRAGALCTLYSYSLTNKTLRTVFRQEGISPKEARYSPDGEWIVFTAWVRRDTKKVKGGSEQILLVDKNGTGLRFLTNYDYGFRTNYRYGNIALSIPNFSPDGRFVIFSNWAAIREIEINRVTLATGKLEIIGRLMTNTLRAVVYNGNNEEIIFPVHMEWDGKSKGNTGEDMRDVPCRDSQPVAESNGLNWRLCKFNLVTGVSTTIYNQHSADYLFPQNGRLPVVFSTAGKQVTKIASDYIDDLYMSGADIQIMSYDGKEVKLLMNYHRQDFGKRHTGDRSFSSASISPTGDKIAYADYNPSIIHRIRDFDMTRPRFSVRDLKTGKVEEFIVPLPKEESKIYLDYVKPKLAAPEREGGGVQKKSDS